MKMLVSFFSMFLSLSASISAQSQIVWSAEKNVAPAVSGNDHPRLALDRNGNPMVVWSHAGNCINPAVGGETILS